MEFPEDFKIKFQGALLKVFTEKHQLEFSENLLEKCPDELIEKLP